MSKTVLATGALKPNKVSSIGSRCSSLTRRETQIIVKWDNNVLIQNREATNAFVSGSNKINVKKL